MDPTIEALTIYPAAWTALFEGLAQGIAFGLAVIASILVVAVVLLASLGGRASAPAPVPAFTKRPIQPVTAEPISPAVAAARARDALANTVPYSIAPDFGGIVPSVRGPQRVHAGRRRRRPCPRASVSAS